MDVALVTAWIGVTNHHLRAILAIGAILAVAGLVLAAWAFVPSEGTKTRTIPVEPDVGNPVALVEGMGFWTLLKLSMWYNGEFSGSMAATSSPGISEFSLGWKIIGQSAYDFFETEGLFNRGPLSHLGVNDTVSDIGLPTSGTYYLILVNDVPLLQEFNVTVHYKTSGLHLGFFMPGIVLLVAAASVIFIGKRRKGKEAVEPSTRRGQ